MLGAAQTEQTKMITEVWSIYLTHNKYLDSPYEGLLFAVQNTGNVTARDKVISIHKLAFQPETSG